MLMKHTRLGSKNPGMSTVDFSQLKKDTESYRLDNLGSLGIALVIYYLISLGIMIGNVSMLPSVDFAFYIFTVIFFSTFGITAFIGGYLVHTNKVDVMYTRKLIHVESFFVPYALFFLIPFQKTLSTYLLLIGFIFVAYIPLRQEIRDKPAGFLARIAFCSFSRPEDEPYNLFYALTQNIMTTFSIITVCFLLAHVVDQPVYVFIALVTVTFGDGLAEIVGRNYGKHKYTTSSFMTDVKYHRTIEGSACVFVACIVGIFLTNYVFAHYPGINMSRSPNPLFKYGTWGWLQMLCALIVLPPLLTWVEARSPHSWDNACIILSGGLVTLLIFFL